MTEVIGKLEGLWGDDFRRHLTEDHGLEVHLLLTTFDSFRKRLVPVGDLLFETEAVLDHTWEMLNAGKWIDVPRERKQVYAIASFIKIVGLLHERKPDCIQKCLEVADLGILLGFPFRSLSLTEVADLLSSSILQCSVIGAELSKKLPESDSNPETHTKPQLENEIDSVVCPSVEFFRKNYFTKGRPVKLRECMGHWPALERWKDFGYIVRKAGHRTVPVEMGKHYADDSYSQKLMKISEFVRDFFREDAETVGYLAQHQLFDQVPELRKDITEPDYCALTESADCSVQTEINAWFGPKGTVSPLHFDPKHNLLCQVVGSKKIVMYPPSDSEFLYPHESSMLFNTSRVDVENPDLESFPKFERARKRECLLSAGEMLYIPPKYWHHVRALEDSFSVSFWWE